MFICESWKLYWMMNCCIVYYIVYGVRVLNAGVLMMDIQAGMGILLGRILIIKHMVALHCNALHWYKIH